MPRSIEWIALSLLATLGACGGQINRPDEIGSPVNASPCGARGDIRGACICAGDGRWLCAGQSSVVCRGVYMQGGGRALVDVERGCDGEWTECSDLRVYGVRCDGLRCVCSVDGEDSGSFLTPRCPEEAELNRSCGWSFELPSVSGGVPLQGMPCPLPGRTDPQTACLCTDAGWDCPTSSPCRLAGTWRAASGGRLVIEADGTFFWADDPASSEVEVESGQAAGFVGTWGFDGATVSLRSLHARSTPSCEERPARYTVAFGSSCGALDLAAASDTCEPRAAALGALHATRD